MIRLYLFAEGQTEQTFADNLVKPHLWPYEVFLDKSILVAHGRKKGQVHRGGGRNYIPMKNDIVRFLKQEKAENVFFTTMIDLYAIHSDFPGLTESESFRHNPVKRVEYLENIFFEDIADPRFIPYIQLHEYEAYLFSDPDCFKYIGNARVSAIEQLKSVAQNYSTPEYINDGLRTAPSKRIIEQFPDYGKAKSVFGPQLAENIGLQKIREKCAHLDGWLSRLEALNG